MSKVPYVKTPLDLALAEWRREVIAGRADRKPPHWLATQAAIHVFGRGRPLTAAGRLNWVAIPPRAKRGNNLTLKRRIERSYDTIRQGADRKSHSRKELGKPSTITRVQHRTHRQAAVSLAGEVGVGGEGLAGEPDACS
jgi:hypothetical protein